MGPASSWRVKVSHVQVIAREKIHSTSWKSYTNKLGLLYLDVLNHPREIDNYDSLEYIRTVDAATF
jgi:hypothetical protein